jgi:protein arginine kinase activator
LFFFGPASLLVLGWMKCDQCEHEATVHEVTIRGGAKVERHLCQSCAAGVGLAPGGDASSTLEVLKIAIETSGAGGPAGATVIGPGGKGAGKPAACGTCGTTWEAFKSAGMLGCPNCYEEFEGRLIPLIERAHEGASQHVGKAPVRASGQAADSRSRAVAALVEERAQRVAALRRMLDDSVRGEQYERAAQLRDELRRLSDQPIDPASGLGDGGRVA